MSYLDSLSDNTRRCIERLSRPEYTCPDISAHPSKRLAAVLVLLFEQDGQLRVLLTTRSKTLRSHPNQTALPGGKVDDTDRNMEHTALREAHEEVSLPLNSPAVHTVNVLSPTISASRLIVSPVVAFLSDRSVLDSLVANPSEVSHIFSHPLEAVLNPAIALKEALVPIGSENWPYSPEYELYNHNDITLATLEDTMYRMLRFRSSHTPVKGLTAEVLVRIAQIAYDAPPDPNLTHPKQWKNWDDIQVLLKDHWDSEFVLTAKPVQTLRDTPLRSLGPSPAPSW